MEPDELRPGTTKYLTQRPQPTTTQGSFGHYETYVTFTTSIAPKEEPEFKIRRAPNIGVVVLTHNRDITDCVDAIMPQLEHGDDICVVEGGSTKEWVDINREICLQRNIKHHWVSSVSEEKNIRSFGRNYGADMVEGSYLYFIDGDCILETSSMDAMRKALSPEAILVGQVEFLDEDGEFLYYDHRYPQFGFGYKATTFPWMMDEKNCVIPRKLFDLVDGFDSRWAANGYCWEGVHLYMRLYLMEHTPIICVEDAIVRHRWHEKSPDQKNSDANVEPFRKELQMMLEAGYDYADLRWAKAFEGAMYDRR